MTADRIHGSAPQSSFKRPRITNLLHLPAAELEFLDRRQVRREPGGTIEPDCAGILREHPRADGLEPLFEHARLRAVPEHAPDPARPGRGSDIDGPHLGAIRGRALVAARAEGHPADHSALYFGHEQLRHAFGDGLAPHCLALVDRQRCQILGGHDALVGGLPGGNVDFRDLAGILKPGGSDVHGGCIAPYLLRALASRVRRRSRLSFGRYLSPSSVSRTAGAVALQREGFIVRHPASLPFKPSDHLAALVDDENRVPAGLWEIHAYMPFALRSCRGEGARCRGIALAFDLAFGYLDRPISI